MRPGENAHDLAVRLAGEKAQHIAQPLDTGLVIGSDQVADLKGKMLGKPDDLAAARKQLLASSGHTVTFYTAVCLVNAATGDSQHFMDITRVIFRQLAENMVDEYLETEPALDCAGGFKSEGLGITLFESIESSDPTALIGLPLIGLAAMLRRENVKIP